MTVEAEENRASIDALRRLQAASQGADIEADLIGVSQAQQILHASEDILRDTELLLSATDLSQD